MNIDELAQYQYQLDQVNLALQTDADNVELLKLKTDLTELINLTTQLEQEDVPQSPIKKSPTSPKDTSTSTGLIPAFTKPLQASDQCLARWSGDGQFYPATVTAIGGGDQVFSVVFKGYNNVELVNVQDIKPLENGKSKSNDKKNGLEAEKKDKEQKKRKADGQRKVNEQVVKQKQWLAFANASATAPGKKPTKSKRLQQAPINKKSIFATPNNPEGKVGVVGSGKPMTTFQQRGKHIFDRNK